MLLISALFLCFVQCFPVEMERQKRVTGTAVTFHKYPWIVFIESSYKDEHNCTLGTVCTGSIIDIYGTVITAAHCFENPRRYQVEGQIHIFELRSVEVKWGSYLSNMNDSEVIQATNLSTRIHTHPWIHPRYDVGLIYLSTFEKNQTDKDPGSNAKPIRLSSQDWELNNPLDGTFAGFGCQPIINETHDIIGCIKNSNLTEISMKYGGRTCNRTDGFIKDRDYSLNRSSVFCGFASMNGEVPVDPITKVRFSGPCAGDSGGPYMVNENGVIVLRGIYMGVSMVNWTLARYKEGYIRGFAPLLFLDVSFNWTRVWIEEKLRARYTKLMGYNYTGDVPIVRRRS